MKSQQSDKFGGKRLGPITVKTFIDKNAVNLYLSRHMKFHPVIRASHTIACVEQPRDIDPAGAERTVPLPTIQGEGRFVDGILSYRKGVRGFRLISLRKDDPHHDAL